jgi:hypothetical protein
MKNWIIGILVIIILAVGAWWVWGNKGATNLQTSQTDTSNTVSNTTSNTPAEF